MHRYAGGMTYPRLLLCLAVLVTTVVYANPPPGPVHIGPYSPISGVAQADWDMVYRAAEAFSKALKNHLARRFNLEDEPLTPEEEQCLLNRTAQKQIGVFRKHVEGRPQEWAQEAAKALDRLRDAIIPKGPGTDWCSIKGARGENRGLAIYTEGFTAKAEKNALDALREWAQGLKGRPITWQEAFAIAGAALIAAPAMAPL